MINGLSNAGHTVTELKELLGTQYLKKKQQKNYKEKEKPFRYFVNNPRLYINSYETNINCSFLFEFLTLCVPLSL